MSVAVVWLLVGEHALAAGRITSTALAVTACLYSVLFSFAFLKSMVQLASPTPAEMAKRFA